MGPGGTFWPSSETSPQPTRTPPRTGTFSPSPSHWQWAPPVSRLPPPSANLAGDRASRPITPLFTAHYFLPILTPARGYKEPLSPSAFPLSSRALGRRQAARIGHRSSVIPPLEPDDIATVVSFRALLLVLDSSPLPCEPSDTPVWINLQQTKPPDDHPRCPRLQPSPSSASGSNRGTLPCTRVRLAPLHLVVTSPSSRSCWNATGLHLQCALAGDTAGNLTRTVRSSSFLFSIVGSRADARD
jgi:hypothetical protein